MEPRKRTVLFVDDEEENLIVLVALLDREYRVITAASGAEALSVLRSESVDVLITDQRMPTMTGVQLIKEVRLRHPEVVRMILTAYTDVEVILDAVNQGYVYGYIIKPWSVEHMRVTIRQAIEWADVCKAKGELAAELQRANRDLAARNEELEEARKHLLREEKLAAVGQFASEMAHEMGNQLQVVQYLVAILELEKLPRDTQQAVDDLHQATEHLGAIIEDIRAFAAGKPLELELEDVSPESLVARVVHLCSKIHAFREVTAILDVADVGRCKLDRGKFMHLVSNVVRNAMQASPPGEAVTVSMRLVEDRLLLTVADRGPGVPEELRERIFEPFFTTKEAGGTGLGLAICRWVTELHGGSISLRCPESGGALFTIALPRLTD